MKIKPRTDKILVQPDEAPGKLGAIHMSDTARAVMQKSAMFGTILEVGRDCDDDVKVGQRIIFSKYAGIVVPREDGRPVGDTEVRPIIMVSGDIHAFIE